MSIDATKSLVWTLCQHDKPRPGTFIRLQQQAFSPDAEFHGPPRRESRLMFSRTQP